ncbi:MAG: DUF1552 domain-containing protein [Acidobacteriia bacterium]|nr:DUF1552 domain-containing protein [Terriglobia bacterium]
MIVTQKALARRTFLRGMGLSVGLPLLDSMVPALSFGKTPETPVRMAFVYVPIGAIMEHWNPTYTGALGELPRILKPMEPFRKEMLLLGNLTHNGGRALLDGGGDHARATGGYLSGVQPKKTAEDSSYGDRSGGNTAAIKAGITADQVVANKIGGKTRFASLEVGLEDAQQAGNCDSGYSCSYTNNLAWKSATQPLPPILEPRALFERMFGDSAGLSPEARDRRDLYRRSILDFVVEDSKKLQTKVGPSDRRKLDQYLTSVREVEQRIQQNEKDSRQIDPGMEKPGGTPGNFAEHFKLMSDMITIAFQADLTRTVTFIVGREGSNRTYREIGVPEGHHNLTHHRNNPEMIERVAQINCYHMRTFAAWMEKMKAAKEADGTLLDNSMIVYGSGIADGNRHTHEDLPTMIVGKAGGFLKSGRRIVYRRETPICNLYLSMMEGMGVHEEHFGDATGHLSELTA